MPASDQFLSEVLPLPDIHHGKSDLVLGSGQRRKLFHVPSFRGGCLLAIDTIYGDGRLFIDELGMAATFHEKLAVITPQRMVVEVGFPGSVFGIAEVAGVHVVEMELGAAAVGRGFSPLAWLCEVADVVMERRYDGGAVSMTLFDGSVIAVDVSDGETI